MELTVQERNQFGKKTKALRNQGLIPAELYGKGIENLHLAVPAKEFKKVFKQAGESTMINVMVDGKPRPVMIQDVAVDPVTDEFLGVDFYQVRLDEKIKVKVPVEFAGEAPGAKKGGILVKATQELEVEALPAHIPHSIKADVSKLEEIGQSIHVKDLPIPADVKVLVNSELVVATITAQMTEEEEAKLAEEIKPEDIKSETEEKKAEREAEKAAKAPEVPAAEEGKK